MSDLENLENFYKCPSVKMSQSLNQNVVYSSSNISNISNNTSNTGNFIGEGNSSEDSSKGSPSVSDLMNLINAQSSLISKLQKTIGSLQDTIDSLNTKLDADDVRMPLLLTAPPHAS